MSKTYEVRDGMVYEISEIVTPTQTAIQEGLVGPEYILDVKKLAEAVCATYKNYLGDVISYEGNIKFTLDGVFKTMPALAGSATITFNISIPGTYSITAVADDGTMGEVTFDV